MDIDIDHLRRWVGATDEAHGVADAWQIAALAATLDRDDPPPAAGDPLPPGALWLYLVPCARQSALGPDGHPRRGGFLPPVALPRRMWAGGRLEFRRPLAVGAPIGRRSEIAEVALKEGRTGPLVFVTVRHTYGDADGDAVEERQDLVYRGATAPGEAPPPSKPAPADAPWSREVMPDPVLLFRYSALTFNGHRIHYDRPYATGVEGYPGLVVHGPLLATLLMDLCRRERPGARLSAFEFRALAPVFDTHAFRVEGAPEGAGARLWIARHDGALAMTASAAFAS